MCFEKIAGIGLEFSFDEKSDSYAAVGIGTFADTALLIPSSHSKKAVARVENCAFSNNKTIVSAKIAEGVKSIGVGAFVGCTALSAVTLPESLKAVELFAFACCANLTSLKIPEGVESLPRYVFSRCILLAEVTLPRSLKRIAYAAFDGCESLKAICFGGTDAEWDAIEKENGWDKGAGSYTVYTKN